jgi:uncharacterized protein YjbJ (UPF0337 family)
MNWNIVEGNWKRFYGKVKTPWSKFTGDQTDVISGKRIKLAGKIQESSPKEKCLTEEEILPRRAVLRGALAVGCGLLLPIAFSGCDSKKGAGSTSSAPESPQNPPATSTNPAAPTAAVKVSQASVRYQAQPKGEQKCDGCINFIAESNTCKLVEGQINPDGWCVLWAKKA